MISVSLHLLLLHYFYFFIFNFLATLLDGIVYFGGLFWPMSCTISSLLVLSHSHHIYRTLINQATITFLLVSLIVNSNFSSSSFSGESSYDVIYTRLFISICLFIIAMWLKYIIIINHYLQMIQKSDTS